MHTTCTHTHTHINSALEMMIDRRFNIEFFFPFEWGYQSSNPIIIKFWLRKIIFFLLFWHWQFLFDWLLVINKQVELSSYKCQSTNWFEKNAHSFIFICITNCFIYPPPSPQTFNWSLNIDFNFSWIKKFFFWHFISLFSINRSEIGKKISFLNT